MSLRVLCPQGHPVIVAVGKVGREAACPHCFTTFLVEKSFASQHNASKEERKPRRSRDEDDEEDDDEEDEKPRKKKPAVKKKAKDDEDDEDEKPRKKKPARSKDEDDEDDEDDEVEEEAEEEEEIEWTPRKRQLNLASNALIVMMVASYLLMAFSACVGLSIMILEVLGEPWSAVLLSGIGGVMILLAVIGFAVSLVMSFALPGKAEGRGPIIAGLVFWGLVFLQIVFILLVTFDATGFDKERKDRMLGLLNGGTVLCFVIGLVSTMGYLSKLMIFMRLNLEASQPITSAGFIFLCYALMFGVAAASKMAKDNIGDWMCFVVALICGLAAGVSIRMLVLLTFLIGKVRGTIAKYIREA